MKILVISLLRLGDILMQQEIYCQIKAKYPAAKIDLLVNDSFQTVSELLTDINQVLVFPRKFLQDNLVLREGSFFRALHELKDLVNGLNANEYDLVVDLTHTQLSRDLLSTLQISEFQGPKKNFLNELFVDSNVSTFHYVDALSQAIGLRFESGNSTATVDTKRNSFILMQVLTSDTKKNWPLSAFQSLIRKIHEKYPEKEIRIVGAPSEEATLRRYFPEKANLKMEICGLSRLKQILGEAELLISGDTATVHLAAHSKTPVLGIYLGSAEPTKTAPRIAGAFMVQSMESCVPCKHASKCHQAEHLCSLSIDPNEIFSIYEAIRTEQEGNLQALAWRLPFHILRTQWSVDGNLILENLSLPDSLMEAKLRQDIFSKIFNNKISSTEESRQLFKGEPWELSIYITERIKSVERVQAIINDIQDEVRKISRACLRLEISVESQLKEIRPLIQEFELMSDDPEWTSVLKTVLRSSWSESSFVVYRRWRGVVDHLSSFNQLQLEMFESIRNTLREKGVFYVPGPTRTT